MNPFFISDNFARTSIKINKIEIYKPAVIVINDIPINYSDDSNFSKNATNLTIYLIENYKHRGAYLGQRYIYFDQRITIVFLFILRIFNAFFHSNQSNK